MADTKWIPFSHSVIYTGCKINPTPPPMDYHTTLMGTCSTKPATAPITLSRNILSLSDTDVTVLLGYVEGQTPSVVTTETRDFSDAGQDAKGICIQIAFEIEHLQKRLQFCNNKVLTLHRIVGDYSKVCTEDRKALVHAYMAEQLNINRVINTLYSIRERIMQTRCLAT